VTYLPAGARLDAGALLRVGDAVRVGGGLHLTTLVMPIDAPSADEPLPSVRVVPSVGPAVRATWEPSWLGLSLEASGGAHWFRERFRIQGPEGASEVFRLPGVYVQATLGVLVRFLDLTTPSGT
jgi:hypothetical protein